MLPHDKPVSEIIKPNAEDENGEYWDPWDSLGLHCCCYNSEIDDQALGVLRRVGDPDFAYCDDIAKELGMSASHVELFQSIFSSAGWCEYGTSPRGCWPIDRGGFPALIAAWEDYYRRHWGEEPASAIPSREGQDRETGLGAEQG